MIERFQKAGSTISSYLHVILEAVLLLAKDVIKSDDPQFNNNPEHVKNSNRCYLYFKIYVDAIDGTHVMTRLTADQVIPYIGR